MAIIKQLTQEDYQQIVSETGESLTMLIEFMGAGKALHLLNKLRAAFTVSQIVSFVGVLGVALKDKIEEVTGEVVSSIEPQAIKEAAIKAAINELEKHINAQVKLKYPWLGKITLVSETVDGLTAELGDWLAQAINKTLSKAMVKPVSPFTTIYPPDNIANELDVFLTDELNTRLKLNLTGVIKNPNLTNELKEQVHGMIAAEITYRIAIEKGKLIDKLNAVEIPGSSQAQRLHVINQLVDSATEMLTSKKVVGFNFDGKAYLQQNYKKMLNRQHQKNYRITHREKRQWVRKDTGLPE